MHIRKGLTSFVVLETDSVFKAIEKIEKNKHKIVYVVDSGNRLIGSVTDGDFRRWVLETGEATLETSVSKICNSTVYFLSYNTDSPLIRGELAARNYSIPLVDERGRLVALAESGSRFFEVNGKRLSDEDPAYIIAEIGNNHQGCLGTAKKMVELAAKTGVDCVKFQMRDMDALYGDKAKDQHDLGSQYTLDLLRKYQLSNEELFEVFDYCKELGITPLCTPWDIPSLQRLEEYGFDAYKVASADFTNYELLEKIASTGKLMICSTGMSTESEIISSVEFLEKSKAQFILLHCNSTYPTPYKDIHLNYLDRLKGLSNTLVGYSGHERGFFVPLAAVAKGAKVIEKHFTLDRNQEGNDHKVSLLPAELEQMVSSIRAVEASLGNVSPRELTQGELMNREVLAKSLYATIPISIGDVIAEEHVCVRGPGNGLQPNRLAELLGKKACRNIFEGEAFFETDIKGHVSRRELYNFNRPYGIPVRYHDYKKLTSGVCLDFVEFHLSYSDMELDVANYVERNDKLGFAVHAPELFVNDHLLDLASYDDEYRNESVKNLQRVIDQTNALKAFFPKTDQPVIVVNAGGWNPEGFWPRKDIETKYEFVKKSLSELDQSGVSIAIQTMPPFPWHFGGQSHHSLFVDADEIVQFCRDTSVGVCLDLSHSTMACNYFDSSIYDFVEKVAPFTTHFHIVDAKGVDGEGIQIGYGDVDFERIGRLLNAHAPNIQFIPEVWQGHTNNGEGFWHALNYLENKFK